MVWLTIFLTQQSIERNEYGESEQLHGYIHTFDMFDCLKHNDDFEVPFPGFPFTPYTKYNDSM